MALVSRAYRARKSKPLSPSQSPTAYSYSPDKMSKAEVLKDSICRGYEMVEPCTEMLDECRGPHLRP
jgi:hypothetical protein